MLHYSIEKLPGDVIRLHMILQLFSTLIQFDRSLLVTIKAISTESMFKLLQCRLKTFKIIKVGFEVLWLVAKLYEVCLSFATNFFYKS